MELRCLTYDEAIDALPRIAEIMIDAVAAGSGVSFLHPLSFADSEKFWRDQLPGVKAGRSFIFAAMEQGEIMGVIMLAKAWAPNQPHRGDVAKLLVHSKHKRRGIGTALMRAVEDKARAIGLKLITFDATADGVPDRLYRSLGFQVAGRIPGYAYTSRGGKLDDVVFFYKQL